MKFRYFIFFIVILIFINLYLNRFFYKPFKTKINFGNNTLFVKLAITETERQRGLSGVKKLSDDEGVLFVFPNSARHQFWMKDMNFPLDFVWLKDKKVMEIKENVPVLSNGKWTTN